MLTVDEEAIKVITKTITYTQVQTGSTVNTLDLYTLPAGYAHESALTKATIAFSGGAIATVTSEIGITGSLAKYVIAPFDIKQTVGAAVHSIDNAVYLESYTGNTVIKVTFRSTGANLSALTQGSVTFKIHIRKLK